MNKLVGRGIVAFVATLVIMQFAGFPVYGIFSAVGAIELPQGGSPTQFFFSVLVMKIGVALGFVLLFVLAAPTIAGRWWLYAVVWWLMYAIVEVGQAIGPGYSAAEAVAGVISEAIYFPLSSVVVARIMGRERSAV
jgi:hypothetical protein